MSDPRHVMDEARLADLTTILQCVRCGGSVAAAANGLACLHCGHTAPVVDGVVFVRRGDEDPAIDRERRAVAEIEAGLPEEYAEDAVDFSLPALLRSRGPLRRAFLSLPYDDGSPLFSHNEYFRNVSGFAGSFDWIVNALRLPAGSRVLDVGADLAWSTARLAQRGWRPVGIDINHHLVAARVFRELGLDVATVNVDMHMPAFRDGAFDGVTAFNALHHTHRLDELVQNLARMLRVGGRMGLVEPYWFFDQNRQVFGVEQIEAGINENVYRLEEWHRTLVRHGLELDTFFADRAFNAIYVRVATPRDIGLDQARAEVVDPYYRAALAPAGSSRVEGPAGTTITVPVEVRNTSPRRWCAVSQIWFDLSYHLLDRAAIEGAPPTMRQFDNVRTPMRVDLGPGEAVTIPMQVHVPARRGRYVVEADLVHEHVTWFSDRGVATARIDLDAV